MLEALTSLGGDRNPVYVQPHPHDLLIQKKDTKSYTCLTPALLIRFLTYDTEGKTMP